MVSAYSQYNKSLDMKWKRITDDLPITFEDGDWDGLRSESVVVRTTDNEKLTARLYSGTLDGSKFNNWYDSNSDLEIDNVEAWLYLPPFI
ncbi:MAG: hypothetical protein COB15_09650 [Flavobacteriales bacterium]|nr:MAG: hypothetical protein COB15_09650 [Flavobacteriales bacterium]